MEIDLQFHSSEVSDRSYTIWLQALPIQARVISYPKSGVFSASSIMRRGYRKCIRPFFWNRYEQPLFLKDPAFFKIRPRTMVSGHFQSLYYLMPRDEQILAELDLCFIAPPPAVELARSIEAGNYVSIHVRRGDYVDGINYDQVNYFHYASNAMNLLRERVSRPNFLVFSDDITWCKQSGIFGKDCDFVESNQFGEHPGIDLLLMSMCSHHIIANSSYSWWAAWSRLREGKLCVLPKVWLFNLESSSLGLVHPGWITL